MGVGNHVVVDPHLSARRDGRVGAQQLEVLRQERPPGLDVGVDEAEQVAVVTLAPDRVQRHAVGHHRVGGHVQDLDHPAGVCGRVVLE